MNFFITFEPSWGPDPFSLKNRTLFRCKYTGFTCAIVIPIKTMSIIGSVLVSIVALIIVAVVFGNLNNEEEYIEN